MCLTLLFIFGLSAQEVQRFGFDLGAGFTEPAFATGDHLDTGWNIQGGVGFNLWSYVGAKLQGDFNSMGINSTTLNRIGFPGGNLNIFSATIDPIVHLNPHGHTDVYLIGGGGLYHRDQEFTRPAIATFTGFDPFFGIFFPVAVPTMEILASYSVNKPGVNGGVGV